MEAAASVVGVVSFGLGLAKSLQAFIDSVIEAEETFTLIVADVNATASTLKRLQDLIDQDKAASEEEHRATVFNCTGISEIGSCALQCQKIYVQIIILIEKASIQASKDKGKDTGTQSSVADELDNPAVRLEAFSMSVTKLGGKMRWPWLEPRIKRCQEHLGRLKLSLMLSLQVFLIAERRARPSGASILGTDDENEIRDRTETLRKKMTKLKAKRSLPNQSNRQQPGSHNGVKEGTNATSTTSKVSTTSTDSSSTTDSCDYFSRATSSSLESNRGHISRKSGKSRKLRKSRARKALHALKAHVRKRIDRRAVFKKDSESMVFEAYLIYPLLGSLSWGNWAPPPIKLPFGHRRLTREVKRALRKCNPWDILLVLSPQHRFLVDRVVQQVQLAGAGNTNLCLVAIDVDGHSDADISGLPAGGLTWTRMVLFFRHEVVHVRRESTENKTDMIRERPRFAVTVRDMFLGGQSNRRKRLELQERLKREKDEEIREEAKKKADRESIEKGKAELEETKKMLKAERIRIEEEKKAMESKHQALQYAEEAALKDLDKSTGDGEPKKTSEAEHAKRLRERANAKASEEEAAREKAKQPIQLKDAVGRKFSFPFHLVQTWEGMEDLIKQAFQHVHIVGPHVQEGHYDLVDSEGRIIMPSLWSSTIKPGDSISMHMWPAREAPRPPQPTSSFPGRPMEGVPPSTGITPQMGQTSHSAARSFRRDLYETSMAGGMPHPLAAQGPRLSSPNYPPGWTPQQLPLLVGPAMRQATVDTGEGRKGKAHTRRAKKNLNFFGGTKLRRKGGKEKHKHSKPKIVGPRDDKASEGADKGENVEDIDKELGLDDLEGAEQMDAKDIDKLLELWTNSARNEEQDQVVP